MNREPWFVDSLKPADGLVWQKSDEVLEPVTSTHSKTPIFYQ